MQCPECDAPGLVAIMASREGLYRCTQCAHTWYASLTEEDDNGPTDAEIEEMEIEDQIERDMERARGES